MELETADGGTLSIDPRKIPLSRIGGRGTRVTQKQVTRVKTPKIKVHQFEGEQPDEPKPVKKTPNLFG